jgi:hypothetical protein
VSYGAGKFAVFEASAVVALGTAAGIGWETALVCGDVVEAGNCKFRDDGDD